MRIIRSYLDRRRARRDRPKDRARLVQQHYSTRVIPPELWEECLELMYEGAVPPRKGRPER